MNRDLRFCARCPSSAVGGVDKETGEARPGAATGNDGNYEGLIWMDKHLHFFLDTSRR